MPKRKIEKKIIYLRTLLGETNGFYRRLQIKFCIFNEKCKLRKYKK